VSLKDDRKGVWGCRILVVRERRIRALEALQKEAAVHRPYRPRQGKSGDLQILDVVRPTRDYRPHVQRHGTLARVPTMDRSHKDCLSCTLFCLL
jgi:hypothetical protein